MGLPSTEGSQIVRTQVSVEVLGLRRHHRAVQDRDHMSVGLLVSCKYQPADGEFDYGIRCSEDLPRWRLTPFCGEEKNLGVLP